jgi:hypothetical protein
MPKDLPAETQACAEFIPCLARLPQRERVSLTSGDADVAHR